MGEARGPAASETARRPSAGEAAPSWSSPFPGDELDDLDELRRLLGDEKPRTAEDLADLLDAVSAKAVRIRTTMLRMVADRLASAEEEAASIRRTAFEEATRTRREATRVMAQRLEEAEGAAAAIRRAAVAEDRRAKRKALVMLTRAVADVESLRDGIARLFDSAEGVVPSVTQAADQVRQLVAELRAHSAPPLEAMSDPESPTTGKPGASGSPDRMGRPVTSDSPITSPDGPAASADYPTRGVASATRPASDGGP